MATETLQKALQKPYDRLLFATEVLSPVFGTSLAIFNNSQLPNEIPNATESKVIERVGIYGKISLADGGEVSCYEIRLQPQVRIDQNKVAIQHYVRKLLTSGEGALVSFIAPGNKDMWRFTLAAKESILTDKGIEEKAIHPKRYTFLVETGAGKRNKTMAERLESLSLVSELSLEALIEAFSVERMSKAFFDEYKEHYQNFVQYLTGKRMVRKGSKWEEKEVPPASPFLKSVFNGNEKNARDFCKKLLGRIIFLYFVQKKHWLGASDTDYEDGSENFIYELFEETGGDERFFPHGLTELFFNALNQERPDDDYTTPTGRKVKIPFLNGGLFTRDAVDGLLHKQGDLMTFPSELFSNPEKKDIPLPKGASVVIADTPYRGFLDFLNAYNFTVYEDGEDDHTVAVDPEMLGHIFENLLEDNKDKGAFYTPKEIVSYMCQESLIEYLKTHVKMDTERLQNLVREKETEGISKDTLLQIDERLRTVRICDPAIGSGAFPMGLLQEIFNTREIIAYATDLDWDAGKVKEDVIQNSIYGVDIEKGAVDIARLRFWLSLVVDKDKPKALPNLDYKIVVGDSLLSKVKLDGRSEIIHIDWSTDTVKEGLFGQQLAEDRLKIIGQIHDKQKAFFHPQAKNKERLKKEIRELKIDLLLTQLEKMVKTQGLEKPPMERGRKATQQTKLYLDTQGWIQNIKKLQKLKESPKLPFDHFDWKLDFPEVLSQALAGDEGGFDIVIGNPPYLRVQGIREKDTIYADELVEQYRSATGSFDLYGIFVEKSLELLNSCGILNFIMPVKWTNAAFGSGLREIISQRNYASKIISFGAHQVFNASTYTGLQWFKQDCDHLNYHELDRDILSKDELSQFLKTLKSGEESHISNKSLNQESWVLTTGKTSELLKKLNRNPRRLGDIFEKIFTGLQTSKDSVYFLYDCTEADDYIEGFSKELGDRVKIEKGITKPLLKGNDVHRYEPVKADKVVIFPYKLKGGAVELYSEQEIIDQFPFGYRYLKQCENILRDREKGRLKYDNYWYRYIYPKNLSLFQYKKLVAPEISKGGNFSFDKNGGFYSTTTVYGYIKKIETKESYKCLMGILNSQLFWWYLVHTGTVLSNGYFRYKPNYVKTFPIPDSISLETEIAIEKLVNDIVREKSKQYGGNTRKLNADLNHLIYRLYRLNKNEMELVDSLKS